MKPNPFAHYPPIHVAFMINMQQQPTTSLLLMPREPANPTISFTSPTSHPSEKASFGKIVNTIRKIGGIAGRVANTAGKIALVASMV